MIEDIMRTMEASAEAILADADALVAKLRSMHAQFAAAAQICRDLAKGCKDSDQRLEARFLGMARRFEEQRTKMQTRLATPPSTHETTQARRKLEAVMNIGALLTIAGGQAK